MASRSGEVRAERMLRQICSSSGVIVVIVSYGPECFAAILWIKDKYLDREVDVISLALLFLSQSVRLSVDFYSPLYLDHKIKKVDIIYMQVLTTKVPNVESSPFGISLALWHYPQFLAV